MRTKSLLSRASIVLAAGLALAGPLAPLASAADTPVDYACQATPPLGSAQNFDLPAGVNATAPASVAAGSQFSITLAPDALTVPSSVSGYSVQSIGDIQLSIPVPANATLNSESLSGGSGISQAAVSVSGSNVVLTVNDSLPGGSTFTLPAVTLNLTAGASGGTVQTTLGGTGYSDPGLTFSATVPVAFFTVNVPTACYPAAATVLSSTTID
ncbi:cyclodehydratase [Kitasatospora viridis]|uniref:Dehydratase n=1 Tax=Kitasatospora viridis TaxID=281105 RepID=A0A561UPG4_9ACTN|nr:cyclodehydratase [Kitasatospora viridis]TWG01263.1 dehydratase [Kitasatospora viridis]